MKMTSTKSGICASALAFLGLKIRSWCFGRNTFESISLFCLILFALSGKLSLEANPFVQGNTRGGLGNKLFTIATTYAYAWDHQVEVYIPNLEYKKGILHDHVFSHCNTTNPMRRPLHVWTEPSHAYYEIPYQPDLRLSGYFQSEKHYYWLIQHPNTVAIHFRYYYPEDRSGNIHIQYGKDYVAKAIDFFS